MTMFRFFCWCMVGLMMWVIFIILIGKLLSALFAAA